MPAGAEFNLDTQLFSWKPNSTHIGSYQVTFTVTDSGLPPASDAETITITVQKTTKKSGGTSNVWQPAPLFQSWFLPDNYWNYMGYQQQQPWGLLDQPLLPLDQFGTPIFLSSYQQLQQSWYQSLYPQFYIPYSMGTQPWSHQQYQFLDFISYQKKLFFDML